jgi:hypothetical protein
MDNLPAYIGFLFILATIFSVGLFLKAASWNRPAFITLTAWIAIQVAVSCSGFYTNVAGIPPRFAIAVVPPLLGILFLFAIPKGRHFLDTLDLSALTLLHTVRIPVEIVLLSLFVQRTIPQEMTFEGRNFDILSGITAPLMYYLSRRHYNTKLLLLWNIVCVCLLLNVVITAVLAAPFTFQQIAFRQPNIAVLYFPFALLPSVIVPLVLLSHLAAIRQLLRKPVLKFV